MKSYRVTYERDESGWWIARLHGVAGVHSNGRTIADARRRVREALALALDDDRAAAGARLIDRVVLPAAARRTLERATAARKRAEAQTSDARRRTAAAVHELRRKLGLSMRDVADLLGISHQRVQQLSSDSVTS